VGEAAVRTIVVWSPDWPVTAAVLDGAAQDGAPVAVLSAGQVLACSPAARADGVRRGLRRREAQSRCPDLTVLADDPDGQARLFEPVVAAIEASCAGVEVVRPGLIAVAARGPTRYYGGEETVLDHLRQACPVPCRVAVADGVYAATIAAQGLAGEDSGAIVAPGASADFLAPQPIDALDRPDLAILLHRLGLNTLGSFAALRARDVLTRFGADGALAHRLARGLDARPLAARRPPPELTVGTVFDPPVDRVDTAAFAARALAIRFHELLTAHGLGCLRLAIVARTEHGQELTRCWRHDGALSASAVADRVRWQLDGWLTAGSGPTAGITQLRLVPDQVVGHAGQQLGLWGSTGDADDRADRALVRVQSLLGPDAVLTPVVAGGRGADDQVQLIPWGEPRVPDRSADQPWPGRIPLPSPATVLTAVLPVEVHDHDGAPVTVTGRGAVTAPPARLQVRGATEEVVAWAGPWPVDERWWDPVTARRRARFQLVTADGTARLLSVEAGRWWVEAIYD
jgi:protein ImuB